MIVFAHYWGIDEIGVFVVPALLAILALRWAEKRARGRSEEQADEESDPAEGVESGPSGATTAT